MKKSIKYIVHFLLLTAVLSCSNNEGTDIVNVSIQVASEKFSEVTISTRSMLNLETPSLADVKLDSLGMGILNFQIDKPTFARLKMGQHESDIYIEPGYQLNILANESNNAIIYSGIGSEINNYLERVMIIQKKVETGDRKNITELNPEDFSARLDTLIRSLDQCHSNFIDSISLPKKLISLLEMRNRMRVLMIRQAFQWNYGVSHNFEIPKEIDMTAEIPYDSVLLNSGMGEYALILHFNMNIKRRTLQRGFETIEERNKKTSELPYIIRDQIQVSNYTTYMKDFLLAKNIDYWMTLNGIGTSVDTLYFDFKSQHSTSPYLSPLVTRYMKLLSFSPGQPAPKINGITVQGDTISLNDFKGKAIYIDIWASWCGPCIQEIPFAEKLQAAFKENDSIVFLNISVDKDASDWRNALLKHETWKGVHLINDLSIYKTYNISGIPRYILIDKKGNIVNTDAPRPSSERLEMEIRRLLN